MMFDDPSLTPPPSPCCSSLPPTQKPTFIYPINPPELVAALLEEHDDETEQAAVWVLPYAHKPGMSRKLNEAIREQCEQLSSQKLRLVVGCTVHAGDGEEGGLLPEEVLSEALEGGAKAAKLHCSVGDYDVLDRRLRQFYKLAEAARIPVVIHGGLSIMGTTSTEDLAHIGPLCREFPLLPVILGTVSPNSSSASNKAHNIFVSQAHAGHPSTETALLLCALHPNLYLDTTPVLDQLISFPKSTPPSQLLSLVLKGRILFGSDTPTVTVTRSYLAFDVRRWIREAVAKCVGSLGIEDMYAEMGRIGEEAERMVFGEAASRLESGVRSVGEARGELKEGTKLKGKL
ncbi:hypothetical protein P7C70_g2582, partial [Phenoliferia sp. Uapishka_3]